MCMDQIVSLVEIGTGKILYFANSSFFVSLSGAFAGAYGGQYIVEKIKNRENLLTEIRNTNAAIMMTFDICHSYLSLKKKDVKALKENYDKQLQYIEEFNQRRRQGILSANEVFEFQADLQTLEAIFVPIDTLKKLIFEKISVGGRPLCLTTTLIRTIQSLNGCIQKRNQLIESYKANSPIPDEVLARHYFGLPDSNGNIDNNYPSYIESIYEQTENCIKFSQFLCEDLVAHGEKLKRKFGKKAPKISKPNFQSAVDADLMPDEAQYADWKNMFVKRGEDAE